MITSRLGACPDTISSPSGTDSVTMVSSSFENGITSVSYRRMLDTGKIKLFVWIVAEVYADIM